MTCHRTPGTEEHAVYHCQKILNDAEIHAAIGKSREWLKKCGNPNDACKLSLSDAKKLHLALCGKGRADVFAMLFPSSPAEPTDPEAAALHLTEAMGEAAGAIREAGEDGIWEPHEYRRIADAFNGVMRLAFSAMHGANALARGNYPVAAE